MALQEARVKSAMATLERLGEAVPAPAPGPAPAAPATTTTTAPAAGTKRKAAAELDSAKIANWRDIASLNELSVNELKAAIRAENERQANEGRAARKIALSGPKATLVGRLEQAR